MFAAIFVSQFQEDQVLVIVVAQVTEGQQKQEYLETANYPEGYYAFEEAPSKTPPKVRKPPYLQSKVPCPGDSWWSGDHFDLIKNKTLDFFSKTLPILKEDKTLPKVAKLRSRNVPLRDQFRVIRRPIRSAEDETPASQKPDTEKEMTQKVKDLLEGKLEGRSLGFDDDFQGRGARAFCADNWGLFCLLFNAMSGKSSSGTMAQDRNDDDFEGSLNSLVGGGMQPLTPCPSAVEYITPVFARNYQGVWRYVVQIPYEGYFTQTVEVTQCLSSKCHYLSGACLASPRWVSLLVAEVYYPDALFPGTPARPDLSRAAVASNNPPSSRYQQRQGNSPALREEPPAPHYCDGQDEIGCYQVGHYPLSPQVRLYYDWFLIPGSCKCWKQDYFAQFAYRK
ncbi:hypothetical protein Hamer_G009379 [Homarus americanus]|uniref:Spaetzle domain-containing protein n=1 Tax=Homarus americanus TaxID=6706 RepID=A0A8J5MJH3_HOMAM|nr:hypothetical protein Hamer_G009379 [Homarus americanus]